MKETVISESFLGTYDRKGKEDYPFRVQIGEGKYQGALQKKMRAINGIAFGTLIGTGLWSIIIATFILISN